MTNLLMKRAFRGDIKNKSVGLVGHNVGLWSERVTFVQSHGLSQASHDTNPIAQKTTRIFAIVLH